MNYVGIFDRYIKDFIFLKMTIFGFYIGCILFKIALVGLDQTSPVNSEPNTLLDQQLSAPSHLCFL